MILLSSVLLTSTLFPLLLAFCALSSNFSVLIMTLKCLNWGYIFLWNNMIFFLPVGKLGQNVI